MLFASGWPGLNRVGWFRLLSVDSGGAAGSLPECMLYVHVSHNVKNGMSFTLKKLCPNKYG